MDGAPIVRFTMATVDKKCSAYLSLVEYREYEHIFRSEKRGNTAAAEKERELVWQKTAAPVNV